MGKAKVKLNLKEFRKGLVRFIASFLVLTLFSFVCVLFFFKSKSFQERQVLQKIELARTTVNVEKQLNEELKYILLDIESIDESFEGDFSKNIDIFLKDIERRKAICKELIKGKENDEFKHYNTLLKDMSLIVAQQEQVYDEKKKLGEAYEELSDCAGSTWKNGGR